MNGKLWLMVSIWFLQSSSIPAQHGLFFDHGFIPAEVNGLSAHFQSAVYVNGYVLVATTDGLWKNNLTTKSWQRAGLEGQQITALYQHPQKPQNLFAGVQSNFSKDVKTLFISNDGGQNWQAATAPIFDSFAGHYEDYVCFAVRPNFPEHIYANTSGGTMIVVSLDGGEHWQRMNYGQESYFGYPSNLVFIPGDADHIYQGSENPLDFAWLGQRTIDPKDPNLLSEVKIWYDYQDWQNRRPVELKTFIHTGSAIYVGHEGAISKIIGEQHQFLYFSAQEEDTVNLYSYMYGLWVDPLDTHHLIFGGALNDEEQPMQLYETYDEGKQVHRFSEKFGFENPWVIEILPAGKRVAIIITERNTSRTKLVLYEPQATTGINDPPAGLPLHLSPNPATQVINWFNPREDAYLVKLEIIDMMGRVIYKTQQKGASGTLNIASLYPGIYALVITDARHRVEKKFIKR